MEEFRPSGDAADLNGHGHEEDSWADALARTVAHLAAQLTINQIRLRAIATELGDRGVVDERAVAARVRELAASETGAYLRENLGEGLVDVIDVDALERDLIEYLQSDEGDG